MKSLLSYLIPAFGYWKGTAILPLDGQGGPTSIQVNDPRISTASKILFSVERNVGNTWISAQAAGTCTFNCSAAQAALTTDVNYVVHN